MVALSILGLAALAFGGITGAGSGTGAVGIGAVGHLVVCVRGKERYFRNLFFYDNIGGKDE